MKYPATWEGYKAQKQNRQAAGSSTAASGSSSLPATWEEYKTQKQQREAEKAQQFPARQTDTAEREKCLSASGFKEMQTDMQGLFGTMDNYFSTYHQIGASSKWQKDQVNNMLTSVAQERNYFSRYADVLGEDAASYNETMNQWEKRLKQYQAALSGKETDEDSLALGAGVARLEAETNQFLESMGKTPAVGTAVAQRANEWTSGVQQLMSQAQQIEDYLKQKGTPAAKSLLQKMSEYRKQLEEMQENAQAGQITNPLTGKPMDTELTGGMMLPRYTKDGTVEMGYGSKLDELQGQRQNEELSAGLQRKAEKADWENQTVQQHLEYITADLENTAKLISRKTSEADAADYAPVFEEIAARLNYLMYSGTCTEEEYKWLLKKTEAAKKQFLQEIKADTTRLPGHPDGNPYTVLKDAAEVIPNQSDAMKEFRFQNQGAYVTKKENGETDWEDKTTRPTRENIPYKSVDDLLKWIPSTAGEYNGNAWGFTEAESAAKTFIRTELLPEYLANVPMTQEQYDTYMKAIQAAPNAAALRATREKNGLNGNEQGMQNALGMYKQIDAGTYADMAGTGAVNAMENVMTKYPGGMEQVFRRGLGYVTKGVGSVLNLFGLAENPVGNYFTEGGQQGIDYENKDWQQGKQREYEQGRYASELTQNGSKFAQWTANMTRELTQAALEMAAAGAVAGQISAGNAALTQLSGGGKYASSLANAQKTVDGYTKFAGQMANLMRNSSNLIISANAALNSYGEAEDSGMGAPGRAVKLLAGGLIEYYTNGLFGGNPVVDPDGAGAVAKYIYKLTDNETIRKIVSSKVFDRIGEGLEEVTSAIAGAALDYALTGETSLSAEELVNEFTVGVLLSMVMSAPEDIVDLTARAKNYVQAHTITRFGANAQTNLDVLYGTMTDYAMEYLAGDENLMRFSGWSESEIKKAKSEWQTITREFNTLADRLEGMQNISESFERYAPPEGVKNDGFVDKEFESTIRANQRSEAELMTDRALDIAIISTRAQIDALRGSTDAQDVFFAESTQKYLDILDGEKAARKAERASAEAERTAQETAFKQDVQGSNTETVTEATAPESGVQTNEGGNNNEQQQSISESEERNVRVDSARQAGSVDESTGTADRRTDTGAAENGSRTERENLRRQKLNERVERFKNLPRNKSMDTLTADGDPNVTVGVVPVRSYTKEMQQVQRKAKERGLKTTFVIGTMSVKGEDGEYRNVDAIYDKEAGRIIASVSSAIFEPEQLVEHEIFHDRIAKKEIDLVAATEAAFLDVTPEEAAEISDQYTDLYNGVYDDIMAIYEEILADAAAGMNRFASAKFEPVIQAVQQLVTETENRAPDAQISEATRRTPPEDEKTAQKGGGKFSIVERDGKQYVQFDRQVLTGNNPKVWEKQLRNYINKEIRKGNNIDLTTADGHILTMTGRSAYKLSDRHESKISKEERKYLSDEAYALKGRIVAHIDELVQVSKFSNYKEDANENHKNDIGENGFNYYRAFFRDGGESGKYYDVTISAGLNGAGKTIWSIGKIKKRSLDPSRGSSSIHSGMGAQKSGRKASDGIIYTSEGKSQDQKTEMQLAFEKAQGKKFSLSQQLDEQYAMAVRSGDTETAQKMVEAAAKKAGYTIHAYHGTARADRVGTEFREDRATSGPMAFFTDSKEIASNYARDKQDTSLAYDEEYTDYSAQFRVKKNGKSISVVELWNTLPMRERTRIREAGKHITFDDEAENIIYDQNAEYGVGAYDAYTLNQHNGNAIAALVSNWLEDGNLYNEESKFLDVLKLAGIEGVEYKDPDARHEKVYDVFLKIQKPFDTASVDMDFLEDFENWYANQDETKYEKENMQADMWDKNGLTGMEWAEYHLRDDIENGTNYAWVTIPDAVTDYLKSKGYDGIKDVGGKGGGEGHTVWIPFTGKQVKSAETEVYTDDGDLIPLSQRFKDNKRDIRYALSPAEKAQRAQEKAEAAIAKAEDAKKAEQESYRKELTRGVKKLFEVQSYDNDALSKLLEAPMAEMQQGVTLLQSEKDDLYEKLLDLGSTVVAPADEYYAEIRNELRGRRIFVPQGIRREMGDDWNAFKKRAFGQKIYLTSEESDRGADVHMLELAEMFPGTFTEEYDTVEMLRQIVDAAEKGAAERMSMRDGMKANAKRYGLTEQEQDEYQRAELLKLLNRYAEQAGKEAREEQSLLETDERLQSLLREADEADGVKQKPKVVTEPWTISEAEAQKRGFPFLNGRQVYPLRTWVKAADMGNYGLVLDKSTKKGMLTVLFTNKETGMSTVKDIETKLLTVVDAKYQPSTTETAALLASMPQEKLEDAVDAQDLAEFYDWYDGQRMADEEIERSRTRAAAEQERKDSLLRAEEAYEQRLQERKEEVQRAYLDSFGTSEPKLPYGKEKPMYSRFTTLQPGEALALLQAMTGKKWRLTNNADGTWKATITAEDTKKSEISPAEAKSRLEAARKSYGDLSAGVTPDGVKKDDFKGSPALEKAGVKIDGGIVDYSQADVMRKGAEARRSVRWQIEKAQTKTEATKAEIREAKKIALGKQTNYKLPDNCRPNVVAQLAGLYTNERMTGEDLIQIRKAEIRAALLYKMMELFPSEREIQANPELFKSEKLLVLNYRTALRSMINIFGEERGTEIYNYLFAPVVRNTAENYRWTNKQFDLVRKFKDSKGKETELNKTERAYVHMMLDVEGYVEQAKDSERSGILKDAAENVVKGESVANEAIEFSLNSEEAKIVEKYAQWIKGKDAQDVDKVKCENAMKVYRKLFDLYFEAINDFLVAHGMQPIGKVKGYTPHMPLAEKFNLMSKALEVLGLNETVTTLPAEIAGRTETFRPQKRWNPFFLERKTDKTAYDIEEAFQNYVSYLGDILFHTDDIQKVRTAESFLRQGLRGNFADDLQKALDMSRSSDMEEKIEYLQQMGQISVDDYDLSEAQIARVFDGLITEIVGEEAHKTRYSPLVVWLKNYGDILAGKQFGGDRGTEYAGGREWLNIGNKLVGAFAKANVAGNLSSVLNQSAQLAMLQATRSQRAILKATREFCMGKLGEFRKEIDFLTGKMGIDYLVQTGTDKVVTGMFKPAEFMDSMLSTIATRAAYWDAITNGKNHEEAMRFADWYGRALMADRTKGAKPLALHSKGVVRQMLNVFQIEPLNTVEFVTQDMPLEIQREAKRNGKKSAARMLLRTILGYLLAAFVLNRLTDELYGGTPAPLDIAGLTANFFASGKGLPTNDYIKGLINKVVGSDIFDVPEAREEFDTGAALADTGYNLMNEIPFASNLSGLLGVGDRSMPFPNLYGTGKKFYESLFPGNGNKTNGQEVLESGVGFLAELIPGGRQLKKTGYGIKALAQGGKTTGYGEKERLQYALDMENPMTYIRTLLFGTNATQEGKRYYAAEAYGLTADQTKLWNELREEGANGIALYGLMMRMDDTMDFSDIPEAKDESDAEKAKRLKLKEEHRKAARAELLAQEGLTDGQKMRIYSEMVSSYNDDDIEKLASAGMKWKDISELLDKRGELSAGESAKDWGADFANWVDGKSYSAKQKEAIGETLVPSSANFYNKMTAAGVSNNAALKIEKKSRELAGENDINQSYRAQAIIESNASDKDAYAALGAVYTGESDAEKFKAAQEEGIPAKEYARFRMEVGKLESDKDEDGKVITDSRKAKVIELINSLNLTADQKEWIMEQTYKNVKWWEMPW